MADTRVISIRFHENNREDTELYEKLENEASSGASLAAIAKARIKASYEQEIKDTADSDLLVKITEVVQEEMQKSCMKIVGALLAGTGGVRSGEQLADRQIDTQLPEQTVDLPSGALDFLG